MTYWNHFTSPYPAASAHHHQDHHHYWRRRGRQTPNPQTPPTHECAYCNEAQISLGMRSNLPLANPEQQMYMEARPADGRVPRPLFSHGTIFIVIVRASRHRQIKPSHGSLGAPWPDPTTLVRGKSQVLRRPDTQSRGQFFYAL